MRTTIDLPDDLHSIVRSIARDQSQSLSQAVVDLLRRGLGPPQSPSIDRHSVTGFPTIRVGRPLTTEEVRSLEDDE